MGLDIRLETFEVNFSYAKGICVIDHYVCVGKRIPYLIYQLTGSLLELLENL